MRMTDATVGMPATIGDAAVFQITSHPKMVGDMSRVTLNFDLSKIPFVHF